MRIGKVKEIERKRFYIIRFCDSEGQEKAIARSRNPRGKLKVGQRYGGWMLAYNKKEVEYLLRQDTKAASQKREKK